MSHDIPVAGRMKLRRRMLLGAVASLALVAGATSALAPSGGIAHAAPPSLTVDTSFGTDGVATFDGGTAYTVNCYTTDGALLADSALLVVSYCSSYIVLTKLAADGSIDSSYGTNGRAVVQQQRQSNPIGLPPQQLTQVAVADPTGVTFVSTFLYTSASVSGTVPVVQRVTADGRLDSSLGIDGSLQLPDVGLQAWLQSAATDASGRTVLRFEGHSVGALSASTLVRLTATGVLDTSFGSGGLVSLPGRVADVAVRPSGQVVWSSVDGTTTSVGRLSTTGQADGTFAGGATVQIPGSGGRPMVVSASGAITMPIGGGTPAIAKITASGVLDSGFDGDGIRTAGVLSGGFAIDPADGSIVTSTYVGTTLMASRIPGSGSGAATQTSVGLGLAGTPLDVRVIAVTSGGRPIVAGWAPPSGSSTPQRFVARLQSNLTLDTAFGTNGVAAAESAWVSASIRKADPLLTAAGQIVVADDPVTRLNTAGQPDGSFSSDGLAPLDITMSTNELSGGVFVDGAGRVLVGGSRGDAAGTTPTVWRYLSNGTLDPVFATGGVAAVTIAPAGVTSTFNEGLQLVGVDSANRPYLLISWAGYDPSHQVVQGGNLVRLTASGSVDGTYAVSTTPDASVLSIDASGAALVRSGDALSRFLPSGALDTAFGTGGSLGITTNTSIDTFADGRLVLCDSASCTRRDASGQLDPAFGIGGSVAIPALASEQYVTDVAVTDDGGAAILLNTVQSSVSTGYYIGRLTADGTFDPTFDGDGFAVMPGSTNWMQVVPLRSAIAVIGDGGVIARLRADGTLDPAFDGDGLLTVDGVAGPLFWYTVMSAQRVGDDLLVWDVGVALVNAVGEVTRLPRRGSRGGNVAVEASTITFVGTAPQENPGFVLPSYDLMLERFTHGSARVPAAAPVAVADASASQAGQAVDVAVTANDSVSVGGLGAPTVVAGPGHGSAVVQPNGLVRYTPAAGFSGVDSFRYQVCSSVDALLCARATVSVTVTAAPDPPGPDPDPVPLLAPLAPARLMDTRPGSPTVDGQFAGIGVRGAGAVTELQVAGRGGVPAGATAVALNVTVTEAQAGGFVTVFPCDAPRPEASNLNFVVGDTVPNAVVAKLSADGKVCLFTFAATQLIVDVNGGFPSGSDFAPLTPARLLDSRPGSPTIDGQFAGIGVRGAGAVTELQVTGRGGVPAGAAAVALNVTVTEAQAGGFVTVFPCDAPRPEASNLNFVAGDTVPNAVVAKLSADGKVCLFTFAPTQLIVDVNGAFPASPGFGPLTPARLLDSRPGSPTIDGQFAGIGARDAGAVTELQVTGRGGVPADATAVALNVTVTEAQGGGFVTVFPCGSDRPEASNLNFVAGDTVANAVIAKLSADGKVCLFTFAATQLIVDVNGSFR